MSWSLSNWDKDITTQDINDAIIEIISIEHERNTMAPKTKAAQTSRRSNLNSWVVCSPKYRFLQVDAQTLC